MSKTGVGIWLAFFMKSERVMIFVQAGPCQCHAKIHSKSWRYGNDR